MYIERIKSKQKNKVYEQVLLRESYREPGAARSAVKKRTLLNLTKYPPEVVVAIELALKNKDDLSVWGTAQDISLEQGQSIGGVYVLFQMAKRLGLEKALGADQWGRLALWQIMARVLDQGSRLSAVRLAKTHGAADLLGIERGFDEDDLYDNLGWLADNQEKIEDRLFSSRWGQDKPELFLYDVTSSYLEGDQNELADWGCNRDKKRGKKQIVIGLLCDQEGAPVSTEVFTGNTADLSTFESQVKKAAERFGCRRVTFVGDRGMIKSGQIEDLSRAGFHYITAITKAQIRSMIKKGVFQLGLFDEQLCEVEHGGERYILRRNPFRAEAVRQNRTERLAKLQALAEDRNAYLAAHPRADQHKAWRLVIEKCSKLGLESLVTVRVEEGRVIVEVDEEYLQEISELDGCYVLKTNLPAEAAGADTIHDRYKDLALVEQGFRTMKTDHLKVRPIFVRTETHARGHVLVVMLAYYLVQELKRAWSTLDLRVSEGLDALNRLCAVKLSIKGRDAGLRLPDPDPETKDLLKALKISLPKVLPKSKAKVDTKKKRHSRRK